MPVLEIASQAGSSVATGVMSVPSAGPATGRGPVDSIGVPPAAANPGTSSAGTPPTPGAQPASDADSAAAANSKKAISEQEGQDVAAKSETVGQDYKDRGVTYQMGGDAAGGGDTSDCSHYVHDVYQQQGVDVPYETTSTISESSAYDEVPAADARAGDTIVQGGHMGIYNGNVDSQGRPEGWQMGSSGPKLGKWGPNGWFNQDQTPKYYRPKK